ncbi:hypothetical protein ACHAW6_014903 [Cyclotella cf. meneghiniana]
MSNPNSPKEDDKVNALIEKCSPILKKLTFSSFMGYCGGLTAKKVGRGMAIVIGIAFFGLQGLAYNGFINVDWKKVQDSAVSVVDTNNDGTIDADDLKTYWSKLKRILSSNLPDASGFSLGFFYGLTH